MGKIVYNVQDEFEDLRIDRFLAEQSEELSRSYIQKLIKDGNLLVNEKPCKASYRVQTDDVVCFEIPENIHLEILPENIPLDILYEDSDLIVINKPKGMVVHPAAGHYTGTVVNALLYHCKDLSGINGVLRPGIVHRIDKDTSGAIVCAKNDFSHKSLAEQLKNHSIRRNYEAIALGIFKETEGTVDAPIARKPNDRKVMGIVPGGKHAVTHYRVLRQFAKHAHIECVLETGRTHQIRVHLTSIHHPLLGDVIYGGKAAQYKLNGEELCGQTLHARILGFEHPVTHQYLEFEAPRPEYFTALLNKLEQ